MMEEDILRFPEQLKFQPVITNGEKLKPSFSFIVCGMGGSHLSADLIKAYDPSLSIHIHHDYGIPDLPSDILDKSLFIASSYSGNTEEAIDFARLAGEKNYNILIITSGGELLKTAKEEKVPYIALPHSNLEPRMALGYSAMAMFKAMGLENGVTELHSLADTIKPESMKNEGKTIGESLVNKIPIIYSSLRNLGLAYVWKIKFNETAKIPAFSNSFPELNHNEIAGFEENSFPFTFLFIKDNSDHPKIIKRMEVTKELYESKGFPVALTELKGKTVMEKIFNSLLLADWVSLAVAKEKGVDPESVPMIEEFKKMVE